MNERPHVDYFDGLRIFAALCVIFMHTAAGPLRAGVNTDWHLLNVCTSLAFTAVPLFFMMSGYLLMTSRKTADISVLLRHRLPRLVVPLAGWTVVAVLWQMFLAHTLTPGTIWAQLVTALHGPVMVHFWYLYTLIALYALSPILYGGIQVLGKSGRVYLFVLAAAVSAHTILMTVLPEVRRSMSIWTFSTSSRSSVGTWPRSCSATCSAATKKRPQTGCLRSARSCCSR